MGKDQTKASDHASTNALDNFTIPADGDPAAYLSFGSSPAPFQDPPAMGDKGMFLVRWECVGEGRSRRTDGELRYSRKLKLTWVGVPGQRPPTADDEDQPDLFEGAEDDPDAEDGPADGQTAAAGPDA